MFKFSIFFFFFSKDVEKYFASTWGERGQLKKSLRTTGVRITITANIWKNEQLAGGGGVRTTGYEKSLFQYRKV